MQQVKTRGQSAAGQSKTPEVLVIGHPSSAHTTDPTRLRQQITHLLNLSSPWMCQFYDPALDKHWTPKPFHYGNILPLDELFNNFNNVFRLLLLVLNHMIHERVISDLCYKSVHYVRVLTSEL